MNDGSVDRDAGRRISVTTRWLSVAVAALLVVAIDQITKAQALARLDYGVPIDVVWTLRWTLAFNTGMAFSRGESSGPLIGLVVVAIIVVLLFVARRLSSKVQLVLVGTVLGGAIGNLLDRLLRVGELPDPGGTGFLSGAVVDFIDLQWWPVFNVADMAVVVGGIALALFSLRAPDAEPSDDTEPGADAAPAPAGESPPDVEDLPAAGSDPE